MLPTSEDIRQLNEKIQYQAVFIDRLRDEVGRVIVGQQHMLDRLLIGLLSNGHVLLEGVPGLGERRQRGVAVRPENADHPLARGAPRRRAGEEREQRQPALLRGFPVKRNPIAKHLWRAEQLK